MSNSAAARVLLAATLALFATSARADSRAQKYYYEDIASPFFAPDPARPGWMKAQRPGSKDGSFRKEKPPGVFRVFVLGGSIAGLLQYEGGPGDLGPVLRKALPGRQVEVLNCGMAGYESYREALVEQEVLEYEPDLLVFLTGHNEGIASAPIPLWVMRAQERLSRFEAYRAWVRKVRPSGDGVSGGGAKADARDAAFRRNLAENLRHARARGVPAAVVIPPRNYRAPAEAARTPYDAGLVAGWIRYLRGDWKGARDAWAAALDSPAAALPENADLHAFAWVFIGRAEERLGRWSRALEAYDRSSEHDRSSICASACQKILRETSAAEGAFLVEADALFRGLTAPRAPGLETFNDRMHWKPRFNCLVSSEIAAAAAVSLPALPWDAAALRGVRASCELPKEGAAGDEADDRRVLGYVRMGLSWPDFEYLSMVSVFYLAFARHARPSWFADLDELAARTANPQTQVYGIEMADAAVFGPRLRWHVGESRLLDGDWKRARADIARAVAADPALAWARVSLGVAAALAGDRKAGARLLSEAVERASGHPHRRRIAASAAAAAVELGLDASAAADADPERWVAAAEAAVDAGRPAQARDALKRAAAAKPEDQHLRRMGQCWTRLRDDEGFLSVSGALVASYPKDADVRISLASSLLVLGRRAEGEAALAEAETLSPSQSQRLQIANWRRWLADGAPPARIPR